MHLTRLAEPLHALGDVTYAVEIDGHRIGWVGDTRDGRSRRWWACHREESDTAARWDVDGYRTRAAALAALIARQADQ